MIKDDPTINLGVPEQHKVLEVIRMLKSRGVPVILITHVTPDALAVTDRIIVMNAGKEIFEGRLAEAAKNAQVVEVFLGDEHAA